MKIATNVRCALACREIREIQLTSELAATKPHDKLKKHIGHSLHHSCEIDCSRTREDQCALLLFELEHPHRVVMKHCPPMFFGYRSLVRLDIRLDSRERPVSSKH